MMFLLIQSWLIVWVDEIKKNFHGIEIPFDKKVHATSLKIIKIIDVYKKADKLLPPGPCSRMLKHWAGYSLN